MPSLQSPAFSCSPFALIDALGDRLPAIKARYKLQPNAPQRPDAWTHTLGPLRGTALYIFPGLAMQIYKSGPWLSLMGHRTRSAWRHDGAMLMPKQAPRLENVMLHLLACFILFDASFGTGATTPRLSSTSTSIQSTINTARPSFG